MHRSLSPSTREAVLVRHPKPDPEDYLDSLKTSLTPDMLSFGKCIGRGKFGRVLHSELEGERVAVKLVEKEIVSCAKAEIKALMSLSHTLIVRLLSCMEDENYTYLVLELVPGEDLFHAMRRKRLSREEVGRIAAQVLVVLEYIHSQGFVYRDLKPENIMILPSGDIKLIDFGFAKQMEAERTFTTVGSAEYMAPEVILRDGHDKGADWWSYGILLYELLCGQLPFHGESVQDTYEEIIGGVLEFSRNIEPSAKDLIRRLLTRDPHLRLGNLLNGALDLKRHKFFKEVEWSRCGSVTAEVLEFN
jgi:serine/threonine protein kinase